MWCLRQGFIIIAPIEPLTSPRYLPVREVALGLNDE